MRRGLRHCVRRLGEFEPRALPALLVVTSGADDGSAGTLRAAVALADANGEDDTITFAAGVTAISLTAGQISLTGEGKNLTVDGPGVTLTGGVAAAADNRIFNFNVVGGDPTITLRGLTLTGGNLTSGNNGGGVLVHNDPLVLDGVTFSNNTSASSGGALATTVAVPASVTITNSTFTGNRATASSGGAVLGAGPLNLTITDSTFTGNTAGGFGGALHTAGASTVTITNTDFTNNKATSTGGAISTNGAGPFAVTLSEFSGNQAQGGGAVRVAGGPTLTIDRSTVSGNTATGTIGGAGGGLYILSNASVTVTNSLIANNTTAQLGGALAVSPTPTPTITLTNTTVTGNTSTGTGGGGGLALAKGATTLNNSTIADNTATNGSGNGGGILRTSSSGTLALGSTIVARNTAAGAGGDDIHSNSAVVIGGGDNLVGVADVGNFNLAGVNLVGTLAAPLDPLLGALGAFGGPTASRPLLAGSPAIDAGDNPLGLATDQRGSGFARVVGARADVGAFEVQAGATPAKVTAVQINDGSAQRSRVSSLTVTFDNPPSLPGVPADGFELKRQSDGAGVTLAASVGGSTVTLTFTGGPVESGSLADGRYTLRILAAQVPNLDGNGDGTPGDDYQLVGDPAAAPRLFRLFGDADGDGDVDAQDFGAFRAAFGGANNTFDFDNDGDVDAADFGQFRARFGGSV